MPELRDPCPIIRTGARTAWQGCARFAPSPGAAPGGQLRTGDDDAMQHETRHTPSAGAPTSGSRRSRTTGVAVAGLLVTALGAGVLVGGPAEAAPNPGAPPMVGALKPGSVTKPVFPLRTVPAYSLANAGGCPGPRLRRRPREALPRADPGRLEAAVGRLEPRRRLHAGRRHQRPLGDLRRDARLGTGPRRAEFDFGSIGDKPVVGDWNRDGRTDVGVVRGNLWMLRNAPDAGTTWRKFRFGAATDVPVTGDWNGDDRDGIGVRRGSRYFLRNDPSKGKPTYSYAYGRKSDAPVIGDWDGDGTDSVGVVRGSTWHLRTESTKARLSAKQVKKSDVTRVIPRPAGSSVPAPWPTPAGPAAAACPTASAGRLEPPAGRQDGAAQRPARQGTPLQPGRGPVDGPGLRGAHVAARGRALPARRAVPGALLHPALPELHRRPEPLHPRPAGVRRAPSGDGGAHRGRGRPHQGAQRLGCRAQPHRRDPLRRLARALGRLRARRRQPRVAGAPAGRPRTGRS